eukprot:TRINITY_DN47949_c0_g1_i1.p1 TRINITY_DN47949_c0_g1~~TRINITY_DN47949_c0_g1_i1.p1  ORF type:complete len:338 (-),score=25.56 TRINITY_DN47949_c0_g1_i1:17-1030(-)
MKHLQTQVLKRPARGQMRVVLKRPAVSESRDLLKKRSKALLNSSVRYVHAPCGNGGLSVQVGGATAPEVKVTASASGPNSWISQAREILQREGLVILRGLLPVGVVKSARRTILRELALSHALQVGFSLDTARVADDCLEGRLEMPSLLRRLDIQRSPSVLSVLEHPALFSATASLLATDEVVTTAYKWLRAVPPGKFTGPHMDRAYVGTGQRLTAWLPLGNVAAGPGGTGSLCWVPGSHVDTEIVRTYQSYQRAGADGERSGWLAADPGCLQLPVNSHWRSADFAMGDVAIFGMDLLHTTVPNDSKSFRLSCDTRWQPVGAPMPEVAVGPWRQQVR